MINRCEKPVEDQMLYRRNSRDSHLDSVYQIRARERLCHMLGIEYKPLFRHEKCSVSAEKEIMGNNKTILIGKALEYILAQMEQGKEPTPEQVSLHVGIKSRPLGTQLSKIGVKSMATRRRGKGIRIYPLSMRLKILEILNRLNE